MSPPLKQDVPTMKRILTNTAVKNATPNDNGKPKNTVMAAGYSYWSISPVSIGATLTGTLRTKRH